MHFTTLTALAMAAVSMAPVNALNYHAYSSTNTCSGSSFGCSDGGAVCCGNWPAAYGYSAQFDNLAAGTQGQGYSNACTAYLWTVYGPGTQCWKSGGGQRAKAINWFHSQSKSKSKRSSVDSRSAAPATAADESSCSPHYFTYEDPSSGKTHDVKVNDAAHAAHIAELYSNGNFTALAGIEKYIQHP